MVVCGVVCRLFLTVELSSEWTAVKAVVHGGTMTVRDCRVGGRALGPSWLVIESALLRTTN